MSDIDNDVKNAFSRVVNLHAEGKSEEALLLAEKLVSVIPNNHIILNAAATCAFSLNKIELAKSFWLAAVESNVEYADGFYNLGILYSRSGDFFLAEDSYKKTIEILPSHIGAHVNLGVLLHEQGKTKEAESWYLKALAIAPDHADLIYNTAVLMAEQKRYSDAEKMYLKVLSMVPDHQGTYNNLGVMYRSLKRFAESENAYKRVLQINPNNSAAYRNLGLLLQELTRFDEAEQCFRKALQLDVNDEDARWSLGMLLLYTGRFPEGWKCYESRYHPSIKGRTITPPELPYPQWSGQSLVGKSILIWPEQAIGDEIQVCRYAQTLKELGAKHVTFICKPALKHVMQRVRGIDLLVSRDELANISIPAHDFWVMQFSLPLYCGGNIASIPHSVPYIYPGNEHLGLAKDLVSPYKDKLKIGLCWKGSSQYLADADRSPGLKPFSGLLEVDNVCFVSLLPGTRKEFNQFAGNKVIDLGHEIDSTTPAFEETIALISELDLVISSDTSIVHVAAALGKPVWMVLPFVSDWRWVHGAEGTPWYPNIRIFRQIERGNWDEVFARVKERLASLADCRSEALWPIPLVSDADFYRPIRLNLGSGGKNIQGWINVDFVAKCEPDLVCNLEEFPWPWESDSVDQVLLSHVLEHLGETREVYLGIIKELYRVCKNGALINIQVPHPRHDFYLIDPTHVRPITVDGMRMFDQSLNKEWIEHKVSNTPLGIYLGVDLRVVNYSYLLDPFFQSLLDNKQITVEKINEMLRTHSNVCQQINMVLQVVKEN